VRTFHSMLLAAAGAALSAAAPGSGASMTSDDRPRGVPRARDGDIAIAQELDAARRAGTVAAYDLFIERHPNHPLAEAARDERRRLLAKRRR